jgi:tRNA dimethylallyltransferase
VEEVSRLLSQDLSRDLSIMRAIGVPEIAGYLKGSSSLQETAAAGKQATRRYAKRQYTWFSHQPPSAWPRFTDALEGDAIALALALIKLED